MWLRFLKYKIFVLNYHRFVFYGRNHTNNFRAVPREINNAWHVCNCIIEHILDKRTSVLTRHLWEQTSLLTFLHVWGWEGFSETSFEPRTFPSFFSLTTQVFVTSGTQKGMFWCQYDPWPCGLMGTFLETAQPIIPTRAYSQETVKQHISISH